MNTAQISAAKTAELVAFYNAHCAAAGAKPVAKFADRKTAERRVAELIAKLPKSVDSEAASKKKRSVANPGAAKQIAASWRDPEVAAARITRNGVRVDGVQYDSVRAAFVELGLPLGTHIKFRMALKAANKLTDGAGRKWVLTEV